MKAFMTGLAALAIAAPAALAHVSFETPHAAQDSTFVGVLGIGHGCDGEATVKLRVQIPEGVIAVKPTPKPGWSVEIITGPYESSHDYYGTPMTEGVKELIWTGELLDAYFDRFVFRGTLSDMHAAGTTLYFPVVQECATGKLRWTGVPAEGQDAHDLEHPAPGLHITAPGAGH
ncbi:YcnI family protein [Roseovarius spongiae]|nr:DUF1775 domain-containing protein [Roseovarius spongiae]